MMVYNLLELFPAPLAAYRHRIRAVYKFCNDGWNWNKEIGLQQSFCFSGISIVLFAYSTFHHTFFTNINHFSFRQRYFEIAALDSNQCSGRTNKNPKTITIKKVKKKRRRRITPLALCVCFGPILLLSSQMDMCNVQRHQCQNCIHHNFIWRIWRFWISRWRKWWNIFFSFFSFNSLRLTDAPTPFIKNYQYRLNPIVYNHDEITDGQQKY